MRAVLIRQPKFIQLFKDRESNTIICNLVGQTLKLDQYPQKLVHRTPSCKKFAYKNNLVIA